MISKEDLKEAKEATKQAEKDLKDAKKAIKEAEGPTRKDAVITAILNGVDSSTRAVCSVAHIGLKYSMDKVENIEATTTKWIQGVDPEETIRERKRKTAQAQLKLAQSVKDLKERMSNWSLTADTTDEEILKETVIPNS